jgi:hypothetical protein
LDPIERKKEFEAKMREYDQQQQSKMSPEAIRPVQRGIPPLERLAATDRATLGTDISFTKREWGRIPSSRDFEKPGAFS